MTADDLHARIVKALRTVHDPEIPINIYDLGLIYDLDLTDDGRAHTTMTLTAPNCPVADQIVRDVEQAIANVDGVAESTVTLVFEPAWSPAEMTDVAKLELLAMGVDPDRAKERFAGGAPAGPTGLTIGRKPAGPR